MIKDTKKPDTIYYVSSHPFYSDPASSNGGVEIDNNGYTWYTEVVYREYAPKRLYGCPRLSNYVDQEYQYEEQQKGSGISS